MEARSQRTICVVVPYFNEGSTLSDLALRLHRAFGDKDYHLVFIDDSSTDGGRPSLSKSNRDMERNQTVLRNDRNLGHGPSLLIGLRFAAEGAFSEVLTLDGDGNIDLQDVISALNSCSEATWDLVEFVREDRDQSWFRWMASKGSALLVLLKTGSLPADANTPFRLYRSGFLRILLAGLPEKPKVPNLLISILQRRYKATTLELRAREGRYGANALGSTWGQRWSWIPSMRFVRFTAQAIVEVVRF